MTDVSREINYVLDYRVKGVLTRLSCAKICLIAFDKIHAFLPNDNNFKTINLRDIVAIRPLSADFRLQRVNN